MCFLRRWRAKGHGVHSPFAFRLITQVIHSPHVYYAFSDIEDVLSENDISPETVTEFNRLSFRLVHHFKPLTALEIGSGKGINTLFLTAAHPQTACTCVEINPEHIATAKKLLARRGKSAVFQTAVATHNQPPFDAIFIHTQSGLMPDVETLLRLSHEKTFWVFHPSQNKFHANIVKDKRVHASFHTKHAGILFLNSSYHKLNYRV